MTATEKLLRLTQREAATARLLRLTFSDPSNFTRGDGGRLTGSVKEATTGEKMWAKKTTPTADGAKAAATAIAAGAKAYKSSPIMRAVTLDGKAFYNVSLLGNHQVYPLSPTADTSHFGSKWSPEVTSDPEGQTAISAVLDYQANGGNPPVPAEPETPDSPAPVGTLTDAQAIVAASSEAAAYKPYVLPTATLATADADLNPNAAARTSYSDRGFSAPLVTSGQGEFGMSQIQAANAYTGSQFDQINDSLRDGGAGLTPYSAESVAGLDSAMSVSTTNTDMTVNRLTGISALPAGTMPDQLVGATLVEPGYMSTTMSASQFAPEEDAGLHGPTGKMYLSLDVPAGTHAMDMRPYTMFPDEQEVLLPRGTSFTISAATWNANTGTWNVSGKVLPNG